MNVRARALMGVAAAVCLGAIAASAQEPPRAPAAPTAGALPDAVPKPKYGPAATPLSRDSAWLREAPAPDFWVLAPYYAAQRDDRSCSLAAAAMVVNAARARRDLGAEDELATQEGILERTRSEAWARRVGALGVGVTLDEMAGLVPLALEAYGVTGAAVEVLHAEGPADARRAEVRAWLVDNERFRQNLIVASFLQGVYTGDAPAGHMAPVGAYDEGRRRVLLLDPDRRWYEPYWVSEETFYAGLATRDPVSGRARGLLRIRLRD
jgi:hypothetical protein